VEVDHLGPGDVGPDRLGTDQLGTVALLSTSDTDLLAARSSGAGYRLANPARLPLAALPDLLAGTDMSRPGARAWRCCASRSVPWWCSAGN